MRMMISFQQQTNLALSGQDEKLHKKYVLHMEFSCLYFCVFSTCVCFFVLVKQGASTSGL